MATSQREGAIIPRVKIVGGGLAGLAAAVRLGEAGLDVDIHEARPFLGGRAASYRLTPSDPDSEHIDNCQHVLLRCCTELMDFYRRCGVADRIAFQSTLHLVGRGGTHDSIFRDPLPAPLHLARSLLQMRGLGWRDKLSLIRCMRAVPRARKREDIDEITFADWLRQQGATTRSVAYFWRPVIVSALNEEPERASALPALQVFGEGLLGTRTSYEMGVPAVPLDELYSPALAGRLGPSVRLHLGSKVKAIDPLQREADFYVSAVPFDRVATLIPELGIDDQLEQFQTSPIVGIHLWFDKPITEFKHAMLVDGEVQWIFHKGGGYYLGVVSAARNLVRVSSAEIVERAVAQLRDTFAGAKKATLQHSRVIKEVKATYSAVPGLERMRPGPNTRFSNVFLAGDWTDTNWPATMEGAVRSGYSAAAAVLAAV